MRASSGSAGVRRDAADDGQREQHRDAPAQAPSIRGQLVRGQDVEQRRGDDEARAGEIARRQPGDVGLPRLDGDRAPSAAGRRSATASSSRSASRSCTTQCCGPGSRGASQRPIAPLPPPRSWITRRPAAGRCRARRSASSAERAAASAGSRRSSHSGLTRTPSRAHRAAPARTPARTDVGGRPPAQRRAPLAGGPAQAPAQLGVAEPGPQRGAEGRRVAGRDEQPGAGAVLAVPERLGHAADVGGERPARRGPAPR